jgi:GNAT superfamily N-acetyltransferase
MDNPYEFRSYSFRDTMRKYFGGELKPSGHPYSLSSSLSIRVLAPKADLIDCASIELTCAAKGIPTVTLDHLKETFKPEADMGPTHGYMADWDEYPVGYLSVRQWKHSLIAMGFAVDPRYRRRGIGGVLLSRFLTTLNPATRWAMGFRVHERQLAAQVFFRSHGFLMTQINRDAYHDGQAQYFFTCRCDRDQIN